MSSSWQNCDENQPIDPGTTTTLYANCNNAKSKPVKTGSSSTSTDDNDNERRVLDGQTSFTPDIPDSYSNSARNVDNTAQDPVVSGPEPAADGAADHIDGEWHDAKSKHLAVVDSECQDQNGSQDSCSGGDDSVEEKDSPNKRSASYDCSEERDSVPELKKSARVSVRSDTASITSSQLKKSSYGGCSTRELYEAVIREENREVDAIERQERVLARCRRHRLKWPYLVAFFIFVLGLTAIAMYFGFNHLGDKDD